MMLSLLTCSVLAGFVFAAPVSEQDVAQVAQTFLAEQAPALNTSATSTPAANGSVARVVRLGNSSATIGYVAEFASAGFVVLHADDTLPVMKLYAARGTFADLPPGMQKALTWELEQEAQELARGAQVVVVALSCCCARVSPCHRGMAAECCNCFAVRPPNAQYQRRRAAPSADTGC
jgi:hypothetical protein